MYSGEYDACGVTLSNRDSLKNRETHFYFMQRNQVITNNFVVNIVITLHNVTILYSQFNRKYQFFN
jgi:hypothetical protein